MTQPLTWNLHGNDQLSRVLEKLEVVLSRLDRTLNKVTGDAKAMGRALGESESGANRASSGLSQVSTHAEGADSRIAGLMGTLARFGVAAATALGIATAAVSAFGVKSAMDMETSKVSFEQMLGSAQKAKVFLAGLADFAEHTPFELKDLQTYGSRLLAVGVAAGEIIPLLRRIGEGTAAVGTGSYGIELAVNALGQMKLASHVGLIDLRQLANAGVPIFDALSAKLHKTTAQILDMVTNGEIKVSDVFNAIKEGAGPKLGALKGMMDKQAATLSGKLSNFKDKAQRTLGEAFTPALPVLGKIVDQVSAGIPIVIGTLQKMGGDITGIFKGSKVPGQLMDSLTKLGQKILPELKKAWHDIVKTVSDNKEGLEKLGRFVADVVVPVLGVALVEGIHEVSRAVQGVIWAFGHIEPVLSTLTRFWIDSMSGMLHAAEFAWGWIPGIGPKLHKAAQDFDKWADGVRKTLDKIDGTTVNVYVKPHISSTGVGGAAGRRANVAGRASAGPVWAGEWYDVGEQGRERVRFPQTGTMQNADTTRAASSGGNPNEILGVLKVVHVTPDGTVIREELLKLKRRRAFTSLGLA